MKKKNLYIIVIIVFVAFLLGLVAKKIKQSEQGNSAEYQSTESVEKPEEAEYTEETQVQHFEYDYWHDIVDEEEWDMPYVDESTFEVLKSAYEQVDFLGEFEEGNLEVYDEYKDLFVKLVQNEAPFWNGETEVYLEDYIWDDVEAATEAEYYFFDVDGDTCPELGIIDNCQKYIFKYDSEENKFVLCYEMSTAGHLIGTQKVQWHNPEKYFQFCQLDENGENECVTFFFADWKADEELYVVMMPEYVEEEKQIEVTEEMKAQGIYVRSDGQWYFRVQEEQFNEIAENYWDAYELAQEREKEITYTYEELFGNE